MATDDSITDEQATMVGRSSALHRPIDYSHLDPDAQPRFAIAVLLVLASPFLVDAIATGVMRSMHDAEYVLAMLLFGAVAAKFGLMAMWFAWGGSRIAWRMLVIMLSLLFTALVMEGGREVGQIFVVLFLNMSCCAAIIAIPRLFGVRWITGWNPPHGMNLPSNRRGQFSLIDMLVWTTMTALVAGLLRWIGLPEGILFMSFYMLIATASLSIGTMTAMWAELTIRPKIAGRVAIVYLFAMTLAVLFLAPTGARSQELLIMLGFFFFVASWLLAALYVLRSLGHRLARRLPPPSTIDSFF